VTSVGWVAADAAADDAAAAYAAAASANVDVNRRAFTM